MSDDKANKRGRCPVCNSVILVPELGACQAEAMNPSSDGDPPIAQPAPSQPSTAIDPEIVENLIKRFGDNDSCERERAVEEVIALGPRCPVDRLLEELADPYNPSQRLGAAKVLGRLKVHGASASLVRLLADADQEVRFAAAEALQELGDARWTVIVKGDPQDYARLGSSHYPEAVQPLLHALRNGPLWIEINGVRHKPKQLAATALGVLGDERAIAPLKEAFASDEDPGVVEAAGKALHAFNVDADVSGALADLERARSHELAVRTSARERVNSGAAVCAGCGSSLLPLAEAEAAQAASFKAGFDPFDLAGSLERSLGPVDNQTPWGYCTAGCLKVYCLRCTSGVNCQCACGAKLHVLWEE